MKRYATIVALALLASTLSVGAVLASTDISDENKVGYWCENGVKYEPVATPYVVPTPPEGTAWTLLVLKAGSGEGANETFANPTSGQSYVHSTGKDISHVILCWEEVTTTTASSTTTSSSTTTEPPTTTTTAPTTTTSLSTTTTESQTTTTLSSPTTSTPSTVPTTVPPTTTTSLSELPMTGPEDLWLFGLAGLVLLVFGAIAVWAAREQQ